MKKILILLMIVVQVSIAISLQQRDKIVKLMREGCERQSHTKMNCSCQADFFTNYVPLNDFELTVKTMIAISREPKLFNIATDKSKILLNMLLFKCYKGYE